MKEQFASENQAYYQSDRHLITCHHAFDGCRGEIMVGTE